MKKSPDCPTWLTEDEYKLVWKDQAEVIMLEVGSIKDPGKLYELLIRKPNEITYSLSSRCISNIKEGANDIYKSQTVFADYCILKAQPELQAELDDPATATPSKIAIGKLIGELYPIPEAKLKKSLTKPV